MVSSTCRRKGTAEPKRERREGQPGKERASVPKPTVKPNTRTYRVEGMRVLRPSDKTAERNPDLLFTVVGKFFTEDGTPLTIAQKAITKDIAQSVTIDVAKGLLTVPAGQRGAPKRESASQADIDAMLASVRA